MTDQRRPAETARLLARNTLYNLVTQVLLVLVSFWSFPILVRGVSAEGFGLLSIIWVLVGYFSFFDLGVSRAITKFVAEAAAVGDHRRIHSITWTSLSLSMVIGSCAGLVIIATREIVVTDLFHVSEAMRQDALTSITIAAVGVPFMLANGMLRGVQSGYQRFEMVNAFQASMGGTQWIGSVAIVLAGGGVRDVVLLTVCVRVLSALAALALLPSLTPGVFSHIRLWDGSVARTLLSFGGWVSVSQVISPMFLYLDRFMIGSMSTLTAVAYYTVPQETVTRMLILPLSLTSALYPVFSARPHGMADRRTMEAMYTRSVKYVAIIMLPLAALVAVFSPEILRLWMGESFASQSGLPLRILVAGLCFNAIAQIPATVLHAFGRPDLPAKYNLLELPLMIALNLILIPLLGIAGAALAWTLRVTIDAVLLFRGTRPYVAFRGGDILVEWRRTRALTSLAALLVLLVCVVVAENGWVRIAATIILGAGYTVLMWRHGFDDTDREYLVLVRTRIFG